MKESLTALAYIKMRHLSRFRLDGIRDSRKKIKIKPIPKLSDVTVMKRYKAIKILRLCPFSDYFGETKATLKAMFPKKMAP